MSLNSATMPGLGVPELVDVATANSFGGIGLWRDAYAADGAVAAARRTADAGLRISSVCRAGMFPVDSPAQAAQVRDDNRRAVDEAHTLAAECLVIVCGAAPGRDLAGARRQVADGIAELAEYAASAAIPLAVEPMHPMMIADRSVVTSLREAIDLIDNLVGPDIGGVGIALDAYHVWWDVRYPDEMQRLADRIHTVQISDWVTPIQHQLRSRGMPGEGVIDLRQFMAYVHATGYRGLVEVEVLSDAWQQRTPDDVVDAILTGIADL